MSKFKVGELITDKCGLYQVVAIDENTLYRTRTIIHISNKGKQL